MCGIGGVIYKKKLDFSGIENMMNSIQHRGPDGSGYFNYENVELGHRRLSIIDVEGGIQPMSSCDGKVIVTFNGEIYNYLELKRELENNGYHFKTTSDTEVLANGFSFWGVNLFERIRGMFAACFLDKQTKLLTLVRDHFGIKPLYVLQNEGLFAFASELRQFKTLKNFRKEIDLLAIDQYLSSGYIHAPRTIYKNVKKIEPACYIQLNFKGEEIRRKKYWDVNFNEKQVKSKSDWIDELKYKLHESVKYHMISDVDYGAFLSGGIDSTLIVREMSKILDKPLKTFSIGFTDEKYNELDYARQAHEKYETIHYSKILEDNAMDILPSIVQKYGEPFGDSSCIPTYYVSQLASQHVKMVLSGDGADEIFGGYQCYVDWIKYLPLNQKKGIKKQLYPIFEKLYPKRFPKKDTIENWMINRCILKNGERSSLWKKKYAEYIIDNNKEYSEIMEQADNFGTLNMTQYFDMKTYLSGDILTKVDIASMANSLEVRTPFIDKEIWEFGATIPEDMIVNSNSGEWNGKLLLKNILKEDFSTDFVDRRKKGFAIPMNSWIFSKNESLIHDKLISFDSKCTEFFSKESIEQLIDRKDHNAIWLLLVLEEWLKNE